MGFSASKLVLLGRKTFFVRGFSYRLGNLTYEGCTVVAPNRYLVVQSRYERLSAFSYALCVLIDESLIFLTIGLISSQLKQPLEMTSKKVVTMTENDLTIRIFDLGSDTIAEYALASIKCAVCKVSIGERCTKASGNRTVCVARFKYALSVLDSAAVKAVLGELDKIDAHWKEPQAVSESKHIGAQSTCNHCTEKFGKFWSGTAQAEHDNAIKADN